jgi:hypothetical protein
MQLKLYARNFRRRAKKCIKDGGGCCLRCGVRHRSFAFNAEGEIYILYLHAAHVFKNEKVDPNALLIPLCPRCHYYYDHPRGDTPEGIADWSFIGLVAKMFIEKEARIDANNRIRGGTNGLADLEPQVRSVLSQSA